MKMRQCVDWCALLLSCILVVTWLGCVQAGDIDPCLLCVCQRDDAGQNIVSASCNGIKVREVPQSFPTTLTRLVLFKVSLQKLQNNAFVYYPDLQYLKMDFEALESMDKDAFKGLKKLITLIIYSRVTLSIPSSYLEDLPSLTTIKLKFGLTRIPAEVCECKNLIILKLSSNRISNVTFPQCFENLNLLKRLDLDQNNISVLQESDFYSLRNVDIAWLSLGLNPVHSRISKETFKYLQNLRTVSIPSLAAPIDDTAFTELQLLADLDVQDNGLTTVPRFPPNPVIKVLDLSSNKNIKLKFPEEYTQYYQLEKLVLSGIPIPNITDTMFANLPNLTALHLSTCTISSVGANALRTIPNLKQLFLDNNKLTASILKDPLRGLAATIDVLKLTSNHLGRIENDTFIGLRNTSISMLVLEDCFIEHIAQLAFSGLVSLRKLILNKNKGIRDLPEGVFAGLHELTWLEMSDCGLIALPSSTSLALSSSLKHLDISRNSLHSVDLSSYYGLEELYFDGNKIKIPRGVHWRPLMHMKKLNLNSNQLTSIPTSFLHSMPNLEVIDMKGNILVLSAEALPSMIHLRRINVAFNRRLGSNSQYLERLTSNLTKLETLDMSGCGITNLPVNMFENSPNIKTLRLSSNEISAWDGEVFAPVNSLEVLYLQHNKITAIFNHSFSFLQDLRQLNLAENAFACNCDLLWFKQWISKKQIYLEGYPRYRCASPERDAGKMVEDMTVTAYSCQLNLTLVIALSTALPFSVLVLVIALIYKFRWHIRYVTHLLRTRKQKYGEEGDTQQYMFDAFVAFSLPDRAWVINELLPVLEYKAGLKLCIHYRNWLAGADTTELIQASVEKSRKTIVVLSNSFARSEWCQLELTQAHRRHLDGLRDSCILVLFEDIKSENQTALIRHLLTTVNYLEWPRAGSTNDKQRFWRMLTASTKRPNRLRCPPVRERHENDATLPETPSNSAASPLLFVD